MRACSFANQTFKVLLRGGLVKNRGEKPNLSRVMFERVHHHHLLEKTMISWFWTPRWVNLAPWKVYPLNQNSFHIYQVAWLKSATILILTKLAQLKVKRCYEICYKGLRWNFEWNFISSLHWFIWNSWRHVRSLTRKSSSKIYSVSRLDKPKKCTKELQTKFSRYSLIVKPGSSRYYVYVILEADELDSLE